MKTMAQQELVGVMESISNSSVRYPPLDLLSTSVVTHGRLVSFLRPTRSLPCKSHCRNFMDSFPSYHLWKKQFALTERDELVEAVRCNGGPFMENETWTDMSALEHMTFETIPARFEVCVCVMCSSFQGVSCPLHAVGSRPSTHWRASTCLGEPSKRDSKRCLEPSQCYDLPGRRGRSPAATRCTRPS